MILENNNIRNSIFGFLISIAMISLFPSMLHAETNCNCAVFTLDGVQDYFLSNPQMDIIKKFDEKGANLTIGIIGNYFGLDSNLTSFIQDELPTSSKKSVIEVANNGWKDEDFITLNKNEQLDRIDKTQARLNYTLKAHPLSFIAPYGNMNNDTVDALSNAGLLYATAFWNNSDVPIRLNESNLYIIPPSISTGRINSQDGLYEPVPNDLLLSGIQQNITDNGVSVVSMQPLEFAQRNQTDYVNESNKDQIENLGTLLDALKSNNIPILTMTELAETIN